MSITENTADFQNCQGISNVEQIGASMTKWLVENCLSIDVLDWHRRGYFRSSQKFSMSWNQDGEPLATMICVARRRSVILRDEGRDEGQQVPIAWTPCRFGGERPWFVCSVTQNGAHCSRRVTKLYRLNSLFACRPCYRLAYASQYQVNGERESWKAQKIRMRLVGDASALEELAPFTERTASRLHH